MMRNILLLFILLVFMFSIFSLFWKNLYNASTKKNDDSQNARVEKLVKGENLQNNDESNQYKELLEKYGKNSEIIKREDKSNIKQDANLNVKSDENSPEEVVKQDEISQKALNSMQNIDLSGVSAESIQKISAELSKKYGNNPNAEVSEEDLQKIIERFLTPQNR